MKQRGMNQYSHLGWIITLLIIIIIVVFVFLAPNIDKISEKYDKKKISDLWVMSIVWSGIVIVFLVIISLIIKSFMHNLRVKSLREEFPTSKGGLIKYSL